MFLINMNRGLSSPVAVNCNAVSSIPKDIVVVVVIVIIGRISAAVVTSQDTSTNAGTDELPSNTALFSFSHSPSSPLLLLSNLLLFLLANLPCCSSSSLFHAPCLGRLPLLLRCCFLMPYFIAFGFPPTSSSQTTTVLTVLDFSGLASYWRSKQQDFINYVWLILPRFQFSTYFSSSPTS